MTFSFTSPPVCYVVGNQSFPTTVAKAIEVGVSFAMGEQSVGLLMRNYHGVGDYQVDPYGNGNYVLYDPIQNAGASWSSVDGFIHVSRSDQNLVAGTVDANVEPGGQAASGVRITVHVTGNWACRPQ